MEILIYIIILIIFSSDIIFSNMDILKLNNYKDVNSMEMSINNGNNLILQMEDLINNKKITAAEKLLASLKDNSALYHYLSGKLFLAKSWYDSSKEHLELAVSMAPENSLYKEEYLKLMGRHRHYEDDYYRHGYHRHNRGCSCCCCDDCCCDTHFSCCDLICLDQCCECMGGDLIDCI